MKNLCLFTSLFILFKINSCSKINLSIPIDETINVTIEPNVTYLVTVENITTTATFVTIQGHAYRNVSVYGSTTEVPSSDTSMSGSTIGLVSNLQLEQDTVIWYLKNKEVVAIDVLVIVMQYGAGSEFSMPPVPGGCCLTSDLELDPNIKVLQSNYFHTSTEFSQANAGVPRGSDENVCAKSNAPQFRLYYELYIYYLPRFVDRDNYFEGIKKMMTVDSIKENGKKVSSYKGKFQGEVILASIQGQGVIYNVIVTDPLTNHSMAAYVPIVNFACTYTPDYNNQPSCNDILNAGYIAMYIGLSIYGFVLCFLGHYCFKLEVFFFGGLTLGIPAFLIFATSSHLTTAATVTISFVFAGMGGTSLYILWWLYGKVLPTMLFVALNLGYLFASCAFFIGPLGNMSVWQDNAAYGLTFTSGMLLIPIFLIPFMRKLSSLATAVWGSYLIMSLVSYVSMSTLHLIIMYPLARTVYTEFNKDLIFLPYNTQDIIIIVVWVVLIFAGLTTQHFLTRKDRRDFPECPAKLYAKTNEFLNTEEQQIPPIVDVTERTPLLQNTASSIDKYE